MASQRPPPQRNNFIISYPRPQPKQILSVFSEPERIYTSQSVIHLTKARYPSFYLKSEGLVDILNGSALWLLHTMKYFELVFVTGLFELVIFNLLNPMWPVALMLGH